jgi:hypothetical protein
MARHPDDALAIAENRLGVVFRVPGPTLITTAPASQALLHVHADRWRRVAGIDRRAVSEIGLGDWRRPTTLQMARVKAKVILDKRRDEEVAVVVSVLHP